MKLSKPMNITFIIAVVLGVLAVLGAITTIPFFSANAFWVLLVGFVILMLGNLVKGM